MPLGISRKYLLLKQKNNNNIKYGSMSTVQTMCENESYTIVRGLEIHTVKMWKQHRSIHNYV